MPLKKSEPLRCAASLVLSGVLFAGAPEARAATPTIPGFYHNVEPPSSTALPTGGAARTGVAGIDEAVNRLTVRQNAEKAVIDWNTFDVGSSASVHFDQKGNSSWAALNRIYSKEPSRIFGQLTADGKVFLVNQNGVLFGPGSRVNVHTLAASSLNIKDNDFTAGLWRFKAENYAGAPGYDADRPAAVSNSGEIRTQKSGAVFLIGGDVENRGTIDAPMGQAGLVAGTDVVFSYEENAHVFLREALRVEVNAAGEGGSSVNSGSLLSDLGLAGMYGKAIEQLGLVRAVTAIERNGAIELMARDKITTGAGSLTATPVSGEDATANENYPFRPGSVYLGGINSKPENTLMKYATSEIDHAGVIAGESASVTMRAKDMVRLRPGSLVDVGGSAVERSQPLVEVQLNSVELRDDHLQKGGILQGKKVTVSPLTGSNIGDVSKHLAVEDMPAMEHAAEGGAVDIEVSGGKGFFVMEQGARIDFGGGSVTYREGVADTTKLLSDNTVYSLATAPDWLKYEAILDSFTKVHTRYGVKETFSGLFAGGANPLHDYAAARVEGRDAGSLRIAATKMILDGDLDGSVFVGETQTDDEESATRGKREPAAGTAQIILDRSPLNFNNNDYTDVELVATSSRAPDSGLSMDERIAGYDPDGSFSSYIPADILTKASLRSISINARDLSTSADSVLSVVHDGSVTFEASNSIIHGGVIEARSGDIKFGIKFVGTLGEDKDNEIVLASGSRLSASGDRHDGSLPALGGAEAVMPALRIDGGTITLIGVGNELRGRGVFIDAGAEIDVEGGYAIGSDGKVTGGSAGGISIEGKEVRLDGTLRGASAPGKDGGKITVTAENIEIRPEAGSADGLLVLDDKRFAEAGFTRIALKAYEDLIVRSGAALSPFLDVDGAKVARKLNPVLSALGKGTGGDSPVYVPFEYAGKTSVSLRAGETRPVTNAGDPDLYDSDLLLEARSTVEAGLEGSVSLGGSRVEMEGEVSAPAGSVKVTAIAPDIMRDGESEFRKPVVHVKPGAEISAGAYTLASPGTRATGLKPSYKVYDAGSITLDAGALVGNLKVEGAIDISGSEPVPIPVMQEGGLAFRDSAGAPGSLTLLSYNEPEVAGTIKARRGMSALSGGTLVYGKTDTHAGSELVVTKSLVEGWGNAGFDDITFGSKWAVAFAESMDVSLGRGFGIDAPRVVPGKKDIAVTFKAPWIRLGNSMLALENWNPASSGSTTASGTLTLAAAWIDVEGGMALGDEKGRSFDATTLSAGRDIRLFERYVSRLGGGSINEGFLRTRGDLTLEAARIYPGMRKGSSSSPTDFTIEAGGTVTTLSRGAPSGGILSAGGSVTVRTPRIEHHGRIEAPMGKILLGKDDRSSVINAYAGSVLSTAGSVPVQYGSLSADYTWTGESSRVVVEAAPGKDVKVLGDAVFEPGSVVDISGGGSVFAYLFEPGIEGTENPLTLNDRIVIAPSVGLPGPTIKILSDAPGLLQAGEYSILPKSCAFLPGAVVLEPRGETLLADAGGVTKAGLPVVLGTGGFSGAGVGSATRTMYTVRSAREVLAEGHFEKREFTAGDAGSLTVKGDKVRFDGAVSAAALPGFAGGEVTFASQYMVVGGKKDGDDSHTFYTTFTGKGLREFTIGEEGTTDTVTVRAGGLLEGGIVTLAADDEVRVETGGRIGTEAEGVGEAVFKSPDGKAVFEAESYVHAKDGIELETENINLDPKAVWLVDNSTLSFAGRNVNFVPDSYTGSRDDGIYLFRSNLMGFAGMFDDIGIKARESIAFHSDCSLTLPGSFTLDSPLISGLEADGSNVAIGAKSVTLRNTATGAASTSTAAQERGTFSLSAQDGFTIGPGAVGLDGFSLVSFAAAGDLLFQGDAGVRTEGDISFNSARMAGSAWRDEGGTFHVPSLSIEASSVAFRGSGGMPGPASAALGAKLDVKAASGIGVPNGAFLDLPSGRVDLTAAGAEGIALSGGSRINLAGTEILPGGRIRLTADAGPVSITDGAGIHVSAGAQGDAGSIRISAPKGEVTLAGAVLAGKANGGTGGVFDLDAGTTSEFSGLNALLFSGGFTGGIGVRARSGSLAVGATDVVTAKEVRLSADAGDVGVSGKINAHGGKVRLFAGNDLTLATGSLVDVSAVPGSGGGGGEAVFGAGDGADDRLIFKDGAVIKAGGDGEGQDGTVHFRAYRTGTAVNMDLAGDVHGVRSVAAEAAKVSSTVASGISEATTFMNAHGASERTRLLGGNLHEKPDVFHLRPGVEVRAAGDMTLAAQSFKSTRYDDDGDGVMDEAGILTGRAAGNLTVSGDIVDNPTAMASLRSAAARDTWEMNLVAGADLDAADTLGVLPLADLYAGAVETGNLTVTSGGAVYTEKAHLRIAAGRDIRLNGTKTNTYYEPSEASFTVGTFGGDVFLSAGSEVSTFSGGVIQSAVGDIQITAGGNLNLLPSGSTTGAVRTTGEQTLPDDSTRNTHFLSFLNGGDVDVDVWGDVNGKTDTNPNSLDAWGKSVQLFRGNLAKFQQLWRLAYPSYEPPALENSSLTFNFWAPDPAAKGVTALGGGSVAVRAGGDVTTQTGAFGRGDLTVLSLGDVDGRYHLKDGAAIIHSAGSFGTKLITGSGGVDTPVELFYGSVDMAAQGDLYLGAVTNPATAGVGTTANRVWNLQFSKDASVRLLALLGDISVAGRSSFFTGSDDREVIMPASFAAEAGGDIIFSNAMNYFAPAPKASIKIKAEGDIIGRPIGGERVQFIVSDWDPSGVYGYVAGGTVVGSNGDKNAHQSVDGKPLHVDDAEPVVVEAKGDIYNFDFFFPKAARISAGGDVDSVSLKAQNIHSADVSWVRAGGDILYSLPNSNNVDERQLRVEGPGYFAVQAGNSIDLGKTMGIMSIGGALNPVLGQDGAELAVTAGTSRTLSTPEDFKALHSFFDELREEGVAYSTALSEGDTDDMNKALDRARELIATSWFGAWTTGTGVLNMTESLIANKSLGDEPISILTAGDFNVGKSVFKQKTVTKDTGVYTASGGPINILSLGDVNVNEARVMTFRGGDITAWSEGDINAGRGSKTAVVVKPPTLVVEYNRDGTVKNVAIKFEPPAVGSGIRTLTYDPDGPAGPDTAPPAGDAYVFAPKGTIDAGEAGIAGSRVILGAIEVKNAQNISFSVASVGVPTTAAGGPSVGALAGSGSLTEASKLAESVAGIAGQTAKTAEEMKKIAESMIPRWWKVEVIGFGG